VHRSWGGPCFSESRGRTTAGRHSSHSQPLRTRTSAGSTASHGFAATCLPPCSPNPRKQSSESSTS
jgi:hypothetical protein